VLQLEDDLVPAAALIEVLPELIRDRWMSQYRIQRRWLWKDSGHYLGGFPWASDWSGGLLRNLPGLWISEGSLHSRPEVLGEHRLAEQVLYHLTFLDEDSSSLEEKKVRYDDLDRVYFEDYDVNDLYFPEKFSPLDVRENPDEDRVLIDSVLHAEPVPRTTIEANRGAVPEQTADRIELGRYLYARSAPDDPDSRKAELEFVEPRESVTFGVPRHFLIRVTNRGTESLPSSRHPAAAMVATRWLDEQGRPFPGESGLSPLHDTLHPDGTTLLQVMTSPPAVPGVFTLEAIPQIFGSGPIGDPVRIEVEVRQPEEGRPNVVVVGNRQLRFENERLARELADERDRREASENRLRQRRHHVAERVGDLLSRRRRR